MLRPFVTFGVLAIVLAFACDEGDAHFSTKVASDFTPARRTVSVLGVFKDGRMSADGWSALAPRLAPALGAQRCEVGYDELAAAGGPLADAIDDFARANGPSDELLGELSPAAKGELVLVLTYAGKLPDRSMADAGAAGSRSTAPAFGASARGGMRGGGMGGRAPLNSEAHVDSNVLDLSASLYSVDKARAVALVTMQYSGTSLDDAMSRFAAKLSESLGGSRCVGWNWDNKIDPEKIRRAIDR